MVDVLNENRITIIKSQPHWAVKGLTKNPKIEFKYQYDYYIEKNFHLELWLAWATTMQSTLLKFYPQIFKEKRILHGHVIIQNLSSSPSNVAIFFKTRGETSYLNECITKDFIWEPKGILHI